MDSSVFNKIAEIELSYKTKVKAADRPRIVQSSDAYFILISLWDGNKIEMVEEAKVLLLNRANAVLGVFHASKGGVSGTVIDQRWSLSPL